MYILWKWNTIIFVSLVLISAITYLITDNISWIVVAVLIASAVLFFGALALSYVNPSFDARVDCLALVGLSGAYLSVPLAYAALGMIVGSATVVCLFTAVVAIAVIVIAIRQVRDETREKILSLFASALPLGIGTIIGGAILLYRRWHQYHQPSMA